MNGDETTKSLIADIRKNIGIVNAEYESVKKLDGHYDIKARLLETKAKYYQMLVELAPKP